MSARRTSPASVAVLGETLCADLGRGGL